MMTWDRGTGGVCGELCGRIKDAIGNLLARTVTAKYRSRRLRNGGKKSLNGNRSEKADDRNVSNASLDL